MAILKNRFGLGNGNNCTKNKIMKTIYTFCLALLFIGCSTTKILQFDASKCDFDDTILENEKKIVLEHYKKELINKGSFKIADNETKIETVSYNSNGYNKRIHNKVDDVIKLINYDTITKKVKYSFFYYSNGNFNIGNEYIYNDKGEIIKTINHNQYDKYPICYKDAIKLTTDKAGKNFVFLGLQRDSIEDKNKNSRYTWRVYYEDAISKNPTLIHKSFYVDAKTGEILKVVVK